MGDTWGISFSIGLYSRDKKKNKRNQKMLSDTLHVGIGSDEQTILSARGFSHHCRRISSICTEVVVAGMTGQLCFLDQQHLPNQKGQQSLSNVP